MPTPKKPKSEARNRHTSRAIDITERVLEWERQKSPATAPGLTPETQVQRLRQVASAMMLLEEMRDTMQQPVELPGGIEPTADFREAVEVQVVALELVLDLLADVAEWTLSPEA